MMTLILYIGQILYLNAYKYILESNEDKETIFLKYIIDKFNIFSLMCAADNVWITELTLIHKNIMSFRNSHVHVYLWIDIKHIYDVTDKNNSISSEGLDRQYNKYSSSS